MTRKPARKNLMPANRMIDHVSSPWMANISYPVLIEGVALPHRKQHTDASRKIILVLFIALLSDITFLPNGIESRPEVEKVQSLVSLQ